MLSLLLDLINSDVSFRDNPATIIFPISGKLIEPSEFIKNLQYNHFVQLIGFVIYLQHLTYSQNQD